MGNVWDELNNQWEGADKPKSEEFEWRPGSLPGIEAWLPEGDLPPFDINRLAENRLKVLLTRPPLTGKFFFEPTSQDAKFCNKCRGPLRRIDGFTDIYYFCDACKK